jgi:hypothetical protein
MITKEEWNKLDVQQKKERLNNWFLQLQQIENKTHPVFQAGNSSKVRRIKKELNSLIFNAFDFERENDENKVTYGKDR